MAKHAHSFTEAYEMETLKEGTWYIRGCKKLEDYFKTIESYMDGGYNDFGYYIEDGKWYYRPVDYVKHRKEITLQGYLDSLKTACAKNAQTGAENAQVHISKEDFILNCDCYRQNLNGIESEEEIFLAGIESVIEELNLKFITKKQKLTIAELCEKAGLDINNIEIIE